ncbi:uncharacterized protein LOC126742534 isoform X2 [Anthonomus grandis grandis]|uniref:uncharacterized protein LOC126742534 isoform X2 n=1 Tax=Anthonomus grandis grandis TaxID=2921223 RepID=UPI002166ABFD|nr:uncharacterized protein LOC126742534 isoform X2 [Anthonomus grandis grandis]
MPKNVNFTGELKNFRVGTTTAIADHLTSIMSAAMDMFLNTSDSLPFPDILDIDIKTDMDLLVGGHNDFSGFNFNSLEPLEFEDAHEIKWYNSSSNHSILDFSGDDGPTMVNPNAVMPVMSLAGSLGRSPSPALRESHLTFSPATIKIASIKADTATVKKDLLNRLESVEKKRLEIAEKRVPQPRPPLQPVIKSVSKVTPILAKPTIKPITIRAPNATPTIVIKNAVQRTATHPVLTRITNPVTIRTVPANIITTVQRKNVAIQKTFEPVDDIPAYPKPAYSYSCLIAMALKNSKTGCLPVSEIYSFMCKHFPYFKTAPTGWKNSVRHNLSLNKCFDKIEKPALNGSQRKGCLWAMNPAKINKMDEEVQKWSRKDPMAIRKAMVNPETLEALERGELKFSCSFDDEEAEQYGDSCGSVGSSGEGSDSGEDIDSQEEMEQEESSNLNLDEIQVQYIHVREGDFEEFRQVKSESYDTYEDDKKLLRVEMELAQKELDYERTLNNKRRKTYLLQK